MAVVEGAARTARGTVPQQLAEILRELRAAGTLFELAWERSMARIAWPRSQRETAEWEKALDGTKETWRARYEGWEPLPSEIAVAGLWEALRARLE